VLVLEALSLVPCAVMRRRLQLRRMAVAGLVSSVVGGAAGIGAALVMHSVWALVVQQLTQSVLFVVLVWSRRVFVPRWERFLSHVAEMRGTSVKAVISLLGYFVSTRADQIIIGSFLGPAAVGLYRFAVRLAELAGDATTTAVQQVAVPDLAAVCNQP